MTASVAGICLLACFLAAGVATAQQWQVENAYWRVAGAAARITSMHVDPSGKGRHGANMVSSATLGSLAEGEQVSAVVEGPRVEVKGLQAVEERRIDIENGGVPELLQPGHTLAQTFRVEAGYITQIEVLVPTWDTTDSDATLSLRRGGPDGEIVASRRLENVSDNSWQSLTFAPQGAGQYYV
ncbi:MAG: hypothetical protein N2512_08305, partial [Armatimonadetes bacterium]|nr:hypothetical protein [Armatimonadota bacterium]